MTESAPDTPLPVDRWQRLRRVPWQKLALETFAVVLGVVLGMQVSNWNDGRREQREVARLIEQLDPELVETFKTNEEIKSYYAVTRRYGEKALAGWAGDRRVSDADFVIGAYQASQIVGAVINDSAWSTIFGSAQLRQIDDPVLRQMLVRVLSTSTASIDIAAADSPYRRNVRRVIPLELQDAIRTKCGDQTQSGRVSGLPQDCTIDISPDKISSAAAALRKHPDLAGDLQWHFANIAAFILNMELNGTLMRELHERIAGNSKR